MKKSKTRLEVTFEPATRHSLALIDLLDNFYEVKKCIVQDQCEKKAQPPNFKMGQAYIHTGTLLTYEHQAHCVLLIPTF